MSGIRPRQLRVEACAACQLHCAICPVHSGTERPAIGSGFLKLGDFVKLLDENPHVRRVELANYGEIFLNPELLGILRSAHERGVALTASEGVNLNTARPDVLEGLVKYRFEKLSCSIDGVTDDVYRQYRQGGSLPRVLEHIRAINTFKQEYGASLPQLEWQFVVFGHNEHQIAQARALAAELNMQFRLKMNWDPSYSPIRDEEAVRREMGATSRVEYQKSHGQHYSQLACQQLWTQPQINWNGEILGCCRNFWGQFGGNAFTDGLHAALNSPGMVYAREMLLGKKPPRNDIPCATCDVYQYRMDHDNWIPRMRVDQAMRYRAARFTHRQTRRLYRRVRSRLAQGRAPGTPNG